MKIAGACGIASIIVAGAATSLAIFYSPGFSYTQNWLSDLGGTSYAAFLNVPRPSVSSPTTILLSQWGLFVAGLLAIVFAVGLFPQADSPVYRLGTALGIVGTAGLCAEGIFLAPSGVAHLVAYYTFGLLPRQRCSSSEVRLSFQKNGWRDSRLRWALSLSEVHR